MVHYSGSQSAIFHTAGRSGWLDVRNETGRRLRPAGQLPSEGRNKAGRLGSIGIVEEPSVKMLRKHHRTQQSRNGNVWPTITSLSGCNGTLDLTLSQRVS